ncbi:EscV/YscV/HrcV family type III secretion system export apparatus protein [Chitinimonas arctica]|uniref:EscV/YscV/HrcV family type III secretion system export apparatus protein n=1 Tax=Chitinimonas arctica TaxID=2594795 RepID=UPI001CC78BCE|nr:EscV/YscV/HrcV family type III secretion system export apparatus protein [Chitinimonas arctica]
MKRIRDWLIIAAGRQDVVLAVMLLVAVFMMIVPLPTPLVDVLIAINLTFSIVLLMVAIYLRDPLELSVFPSLLLITTLYRLALTISTSRLILLQHDAGEIVYAFGSFAVGGNLAVGLIVFTIITIVQFIVITKGSERVAEVGARFSLDGMPGKQMSIDGDMRAGVIDAVEAKRLRALVQKESQLYGAMDGAMKFVKGDAIAAIIVILVNILGGVIVGVFQHGMSAGEAATTYAVLSVGDGLIAQIPALLISIAAGIIVTRVPGEQRQNLAKDLSEQIGRQPQSLMISGGVLVIFAIIPGFPAVVFLPLAVMVFAAGWVGVKRRKARGQSADGSPVGEHGEGAEGQMSPGAQPLALHVATDLKSDLLQKAIERLRSEKFDNLGVPLPEIRLHVDPAMEAGHFEIQLYQERILRMEAPPNWLLLDVASTTMPDVKRLDKLPFGGMVLQWMDVTAAQSLASVGIKYYQGEERLVHCMSLTVDRYASEFIGVQETRFLMDAMEGRYGELVKELQRQLPIGRVAEVLQRLVEEGISVRDLRAIFEALIEWAPSEKDPIMLTEYARLGLRRHIISRHRRGREWISAFTIGDHIENLIRDSIRQTAAGAYSALDHQQNQEILGRIRKSLGEDSDNKHTVLLTAIDVRRFLRKIIEREMFATPVLSFQELGDEAELRVLGNIDLIGGGEYAPA